jgi:hypothetical protein
MNYLGSQGLWMDGWRYKITPFLLFPLRPPDRSATAQHGSLASFIKNRERTVIPHLDGIKPTFDQKGINGS